MSATIDGPFLKHDVAVTNECHGSDRVMVMVMVRVRVMVMVMMWLGLGFR